MAELNRISPPPDAVPALSTLLGLIDNPDVCHLVGELNDAQAAIVNSKKLGARELLESLLGGIDEQELTVERARVLAALHREIQDMSRVLEQAQVRSAEDALRTVTEGVRILTSRKASLSHFLALNAAWLNGRYLAMARSLRRRHAG